MSPRPRRPHFQGPFDQDRRLGGRLGSKFKKMGGNTVANSIYQAKLKGRDAIGPDCSSSEQADFIRSKYDYKEFMTKKARRKSFNLQKEAMRAARRRDDSSDDSDSGSSSGSDSSTHRLLIPQTTGGGGASAAKNARGRQEEGVEASGGKGGRKRKKISVADDDDEWANFDESFDAAKTAKRATQSASTNGAIDIFNMLVPEEVPLPPRHDPRPRRPPSRRNPPLLRPMPAPAAAMGSTPRHFQRFFCQTRRQNRSRKENIGNE